MLSGFDYISFHSFFMLLFCIDVVQILLYRLFMAIEKKEHIHIEVSKESKEKLKERADSLDLSMTDYLVLKGLDKLKEEK